MDRVKYPRTYHLLFSLGATSDDRILSSLASFVGKDVVITEKMDGENTTIYADGAIHARSIDGRDHWSRDWVKTFAPSFVHEMPPGMRICAENLYARHAIAYDSLPSYLLGFSVWIDDICLSWEETLDWFALLGVEPVPVLYRGPFSESVLRTLARTLDMSRTEGFVVRSREAFGFKDFALNVAKYVREGHVEEGAEHWSKGSEVNRLLP